MPLFFFPLASLCFTQSLPFKGSCKTCKLPKGEFLLYRFTLSFTNLTRSSNFLTVLPSLSTCISPCRTLHTSCSFRDSTQLRFFHFCSFFYYFHSYFTSYFTLLAHFEIVFLCYFVFSFPLHFYFHDLILYSFYYSS